MKHTSHHIHNPFARWLLSHVRAIRAALLEMICTPITNTITIFVIGIAIALPLGFFVVLENLKYIDSQWDASTPNISLYLKPKTSQSQVDVMIYDLQKNKQIQKIVYISPEKGLADFEKSAQLT